MTDKHVHIVSFDVPFPADYGGAIDVFYRLKALHKLGVKITLHCFEYGRGEQEELEKYTETIHYYKRKKSVLDSVGKTPFIVKSRSSKLLIENLLKDDAPILFEGLHCCFFLGDSRLKNRMKIVRTHNIEHDYYAELAKHGSGLKKAFYLAESKKLKAYEPRLEFADVILAIKQSDGEHFSQYCDHVHVLHASSPALQIHEKQATQPYCLFHGNLSVEENDSGARWLIESVFSPLGRNNQLKIAGKEPSTELIALCNEKRIQLEADPSSEKMNALVQEAQVHVFYSDQATGVKLKLVNAMASSGHIIVNENMVLGTNLGAHCSIASTENEFQKLVQTKLENELSDREFEARVSFLKQHFDTAENCKIIFDLL